MADGVSPIYGVRAREVGRGRLRASAGRASQLQRSNTIDMSEQLSFDKPEAGQPELSEAEQKALDIANAAREKAEQDGQSGPLSELAQARVTVTADAAYLVHAALPYKWTQTLNDVDITVPVPAGSKSRDLVVEIKKGSIKVGLKGKEPILAGELCKEIKVDDSTWTLGELLAKWRRVRACSWVPADGCG
jgi:hypothetical protein